MSSAEIAARALRDLKTEEVRVLKILEASLKTHEALTEKQIAANMHIDRVRFGIERLNKKELVFRSSKGIVLVSAGLDALALKILVDKNLISGMGRAIGIGKESDVFEAVTPEGKRIALKFFRIGRTSFRDVTRKRGFRSNVHHWLLVNMEAARHEFNALKILYDKGVHVPQPIANVKHVIAMHLIEGVRLIDCNYIDEPASILESLLQNIKLAYDSGLISADLSEYNVLYDGENVWLIDWPQSISRDHPNALSLLKRDIRNLLKFFEKRYKLEYDLEKALEFIYKERK